MRRTRSGLALPDEPPLIVPKKRESSDDTDKEKEKEKADKTAKVKEEPPVAQTPNQSQGSPVKATAPGAGKASTTSLSSSANSAPNRSDSEMRKSVEKEDSNNTGDGVDSSQDSIKRGPGRPPRRVVTDVHDEAIDEGNKVLLSYVSMFANSLICC